MDINQFLPQLKHLFESHQVVLAYLFGSQAGGQTWAKSDVDLAVLLADEVPGEQFAQIQLSLTNQAMSIFQRNDVDMVILNRATPLLAQQVVQLSLQ